MSNTIFGRGPNGRALKRDGTERKARITLSPAERLAKIAEDNQKAYASLGRKILSDVPGMAAFLSGLGTFRKWLRDARAYSTEDARNSRRAYFEAQLRMIDEKGERAVSWLPNAEKAEKALSNFAASIGKEIMEATQKGETLSVEFLQGVISSHLSDDVREIVESGNDPEQDVFHGLRRGDEMNSPTDNDSAETL